ncbi:unnamed protein product [Periconia digitata]|uniref:Secreted protein n=1 Tax=Periconia digitata TaxID=1303443 RepID=A0A9W4USN8_9PLEO|nr:unnamed protein product [Periconia digitata]
MLLLSFFLALMASVTCLTTSSLPSVAVATAVVDPADSVSATTIFDPALQAEVSVPDVAVSDVDEITANGRTPFVCFIHHSSYLTCKICLQRR